MHIGRENLNTGLFFHSNPHKLTGENTSEELGTALQLILILKIIFHKI